MPIEIKKNLATLTNEEIQKILKLSGKENLNIKIFERKFPRYTKVDIFSLKGEIIIFKGECSKVKAEYGEKGDQIIISNKGIFLKGYRASATPIPNIKKITRYLENQGYAIQF